MGSTERGAATEKVLLVVPDSQASLNSGGHTRAQLITGQVGMVKSGVLVLDVKVFVT